MTHLNISKLTKTFGGLVALKDIDLNVERGGFVGIIGPNGAGKTTLFNCITGFLKYDSGHVTFEGEAIKGLKPFKIVDLGFTRTWQLVKPFYGMSVKEAMAIPSFSVRAKKSGLTRRQHQERDVRILEKMGLGPKINKYVDDLNHGELRLLDICRALATDPKILFLDEPFSGLSHHEIEMISPLIKSLNEDAHNPLTIIMIEHRLRELMKLVRNVAVINFGEKIAEGTPTEIVNNTKVIEAYLGKRRSKDGLVQN